MMGAGRPNSEHCFRNLCLSGSLVCRRYYRPFLHASTVSAHILNSASTHQECSPRMHTPDPTFPLFSSPHPAQRSHLTRHDPCHKTRTWLFLAEKPIPCSKKS